jgi:hypothetical protein
MAAESAEGSRIAGCPPRLKVRRRIEFKINFLGRHEMRTGMISLKCAALVMACAGAWVAGNLQTQPASTSTPPRFYQSADGAFSVGVPSGWQLRKEDGSNEVTFLNGNVSVSVATAATEEGDTVAKLMDVNKSMLKQQCPTAEIKEEGNATVAGAVGAYFSMFCPGPRLPTIVRISASIKNGTFFIFNVTSPTAQLAEAEPVIDRMARSFQAQGQRFPPVKGPDLRGVDY